MVFEDRVAKYPGRWTMVKSDGTSEIVILIRNDEPTKKGTPINAATLNELSTVAGAINAKEEAVSAAQAAASERAKAEQAAANAANAVKVDLKEYSDKAVTSASNAAKSEKNAKASANAAQKHQTAAEAAQKKAEDAADRAAAIVSTDKTLTVENAPADAKATGDALDGKLSLSGGTMTGPLIMPDGGSALGIKDNAATHNMVYRGKALGGSVTSEQWATIKAGTFKDLYLGDYWSIGGVNYLIAAFNYWLSCGDTACTTNHLLVVPRNNLYTAGMNSSNITTGGYVGSEMYKTGLAQAKTTINNAFGSAHILNHRQYLVNAVTNGAPTGTDWYNSTVELMNENMVYGCRQFSPMPSGATNPWDTCRNYTIDKSQLPLFRLAPWLICNRNLYWLRDTVSATSFAHVHSYGTAHCSPSNLVIGVRPVVGLIG